MHIVLELQIRIHSQSQNSYFYLASSKKVQTMFTDTLSAKSKTTAHTHPNTHTSRYRHSKLVLSDFYRDPEITFFDQMSQPMMMYRWVSLVIGWLWLVLWWNSINNPFQFRDVMHFQMKCYIQLEKEVWMNFIHWEMMVCKWKMVAGERLKHQRWGGSYYLLMKDYEYQNYRCNLHQWLQLSVRLKLYTVWVLQLNLSLLHDL